MSRKTSRPPGRQQCRAFNFESLEPRTMMSASKTIAVKGPVAPPTGPVATPSLIAAPVLGALRTTSTGPFTPAQIRSIYGFDKLSLNGAGTTIAIVDAFDDPTLIQDLHVFDQKFGLSDPSVTIAKEIDGDGNPPRADKGWSLVGSRGEETFPVARHRMGPCDRSGREDPPLPGHRQQHRQLDVHGRLCPELFRRERRVDELRRPGVRAVLEPQFVVR